MATGPFVFFALDSLSKYTFFFLLKLKLLSFISQVQNTAFHLWKKTQLH